MNTVPYGTLYGIGVGPGDPDLIPVKSVHLLSTLQVIFAAASTKNTHSQAVSIARPHLPESADIRLLSFPMTKSRSEKEACWDANARTIMAEMKKGQDVAFLTLGDPLTYATYGYILKSIQRLGPDLPVVTIPGISAYQAAAARVNQPLVEGEESLLILSGVEGGDHLRKLAASVDNVVFMKTYRNAGDIVDTLEEKGMLDTSVAVVNCGRENEAVLTDIRELKSRNSPYWTLILAKNPPPHEKN
ncbi:precorrin-2 C(20)-methyltransferase [Desulfosarcina sp. OttesenSCG-928-B08]|nr:precorrin-2 C(20)-methyltransferase [Desulfosarcina sp. OttesenSCG-928-B08]